MSFHYGNKVAIKYSSNSNEGAVMIQNSERATLGALVVNRLENRSRLNGRNNLDNDNGRLVE